jgi:hypothetical protein
MQILSASLVLFTFVTSTCLASPIEHQSTERATFQHPGILHTAADFDRVSKAVKAQTQPWYAGWQKLIANSHSFPTYKPNPQTAIYRGSDGTHAENYGVLYNDVAAAYQNALRWKITGNEDHAKAAVAILDGWASKLTTIGGSSDRYLAVGIYGYEFANAAEIMRGYSGWPQQNFQAFVKMVCSGGASCCVLPLNGKILMKSRW